MAWNIVEQWASKHAIPRLLLLNHMPKHSICAEIGVWKGGYSQKILSIVRPRRLHLIDPWLFQPAFPERGYGGGEAKSQADMDQMYEGVVRRLRGENVSFHRQLSDVAAEQFANGYFDWIYVDGNHYYEFVKRDLEQYYRKMKPGGLIAGDDYNWGAADGFPVRRAVDEFVASGRGRMVFLVKSQFALEVQG